VEGGRFLAVGGRLERLVEELVQLADLAGRRATALRSQHRLEAAVGHQREGLLDLLRDLGALLGGALRVGLAATSDEEERDDHVPQRQPQEPSAALPDAARAWPVKNSSASGSTSDGSARL